MNPFEVEERPRESEGMTIELTSLDPNYILQKAEWLGVPLEEKTIRVFLRNVETAMFKNHIYGYNGFLVGYYTKYKVRNYEMETNLSLDSQQAHLSKRLVDESIYARLLGHSCRCFVGTNSISFIRKKGVFPIKEVPLLINHESPTIKMLAKAKLQGLI